MLARITDRKILCVYIHVYRIRKNWGPGPYNSLRHADNRSAHVLLDEGSGKIWTCSCWEKGNYIMINEFKYGQTWTIRSSRLSLSLYSTFKGVGGILTDLKTLCEWCPCLTNHIVFSYWESFMFCHTKLKACILHIFHHFSDELIYI